MPRRRKLWRVSDAEFRDLRLGCLLSQRACAEFLGVAVRTVRAWDRGRVRVPWAVVRLLRLLRCGELDGSTCLAAAERSRSLSLPDKLG